MVVAMGLITRMVALLYINYNLFACFDVLKGQVVEERGDEGWFQG